MQPASLPPEFMLFTGNANPVLAAEIARCLGTQLGAVDVGRFSDGEAVSYTHLTLPTKRIV